MEKEFYKYLYNLKISPKSHKNYRSDLNHFSRWLKLKLKSIGTYIESLSDAIPFLSTNLISDYKNFMIENSIPPKTINRRLSTLRHLSKFLVSTQIVDTDFLYSIENISSIKTFTDTASPLVTNFRSYLITEKVSPITIKNYLSDINQFVAWFDKNAGILSRPFPEIIKIYQDGVFNNSSLATSKRKVISLNRFLNWAKDAGHIPKNPLRKVLQVKQIDFKILGIIGLTLGSIYFLFVIISL